MTRRHPLRNTEEKTDVSAPLFFLTSNDCSLWSALSIVGLGTENDRVYSWGNTWEEERVPFHPRTSRAHVFSVHSISTFASWTLMNIPQLQTIVGQTRAILAPACRRSY